jgi:hypothetical protein
MKLELILPRDFYLTGENVDVDVRLTNTGTVAIDVPTLDSRQNPQPVYSLRGPSYPDGLTFNFRDLRSGAAPSPGQEPSLHRLVPAATMETGFVLNSIKPISEPGEYTVAARIDWGDWSAEAAPVKFRVEKATFVESSLGVDAYSRSTRTFRAVWLSDSGGRRLLGESFFYEKRPDLGEVKLTGTRIIRPVGAKATNPFCPWINFDRTAAPKFWHGWQEGSTVAAFSDDEPGPRTFDLGSAKTHIVQPTLMSRSGDLDVLVLGEDRRTLRLINFPPQPELSPSVVWSLELPEEAVAVRLGIGPEAAGGVRVAAAVSQSGLKLAIRLIRIGPKSAEISPPAFVDSAFAFPDSEPAVSVTPDGSVKVAVLLATHPARRSVAVAELTASGDGKRQVSVSDVAKVQAVVVRTWIAYQVASDGPLSLTWLIRIADGTVLHGPSLGQVALKAPVVDVLRMAMATYVLNVDADRGPRLVVPDF